MEEMIKALILTTILMFLQGCSNFIVNRLAFHPVTYNEGDYQLLNSQIKEVSFTTKDGLKLHSFYIPYHEKAPLIIYFHGNAGSPLHRLAVTQELANYGVNILLVGYRGYGRSEGKPSEQGIYMDAKAAISYAESNLGFKKDDIFLLGRSIGSAVAIDAAQHEKLGGLILISPFSSGHAVMSQMGIDWLSFIVNGNPFDSASKLSRIKLPALFIAGELDKTITTDMTRDIFDSYPSQDKSLVIIPKAGHNDMFILAGSEILSRVSSFVFSIVERAVQTTSVKLDK